MPEFVVGLNYTYRLTEDIKEQRARVRSVDSPDPLGRVSTAADYVADGATTATLPDGSSVSVPGFAIDPSLEPTGFSHLLNGSREIEYNGISATFNKRLANRWALRGYFNYGKGEWNVPQTFTDNNDPNDLGNLGTGINAQGEDDDGALYYTRSSGSGRGDIYLQSTWQWNITGIYQVMPDRPWGFNLSGNLFGREGFLIPYNNSVTAGDGINRLISLVGKDVDRFRSDDLTTIDLRMEKEFSAGNDVSLTLGIDLFNALNEGTVLAREPTLTGGTADNVQDLLAPRIWKLGVRIAWR